jgi:hypothetical protein
MRATNSTSPSDLFFIVYPFLREIGYILHGNEGYTLVSENYFFAGSAGAGAGVTGASAGFGASAAGFASSLGGGGVSWLQPINEIPANNVIAKNNTTSFFM